MENDILNYIKTLSDNKNVQKLLIEILGKILLKDNNFVNKEENKIRHIRDWIVSVLENNEQWKIPRVLTIEALNNAADKYFQKKNNKIQTIELDEKHEKLVADLDNYYVVQMLTPEALDNESSQMQHCIGHGGYDDLLNNEDNEYLSLRDKYNKAHITLEIIDKKILQLQGKQNEIPDFKYLDILIPWMLENDYKNIPWSQIKFFYDKSKKEWFDLDSIVIEKDIDFKEKQYGEIKSLKYDLSEKYYFLSFNKNGDNDYEKIIINDNLVICFEQNKKIVFVFHLKKETESDNVMRDTILYLVENGFSNIPFKNFRQFYNNNDKKIYKMYDHNNIKTEKFDILGNIIINSMNLENIFYRIKELIVEDLEIMHVSINKLPEKIEVKNNLIMHGVNFYDIKERDNILYRTHVLGDVDIENSNIVRIPDNVTWNKNVIIKNCKYLKIISKNLFVGHNFILEDIKIDKIEKGLVVKNRMIIRNSEIKNFSEGLEVFDLEIVNSNISEINKNFKIENNLNITLSNIKKIHKDFSCKNIYLTEEQFSLLKDTMNFEKIIICEIFRNDYYSYSRELYTIEKNVKKISI